MNKTKQQPPAPPENITRQLTTFDVVAIVLFVIAAICMVGALLAVIIFPVMTGLTGN